MQDAVSFRIPDDLRRDLAKLCKQQKKPVSEIARESLRCYIAAEQLRSLRRRLRPYAEERGFLVDEDVFKEVS